jgi:alpha-soluble NSF attachment protein
MARDCAEKLEEDFNYELAVKMYESAAQLYEMDNQTSYANSMLTKWADLTIISNSKADFGKLIKCYEKIGLKYLGQNLVRSSARGYFLKSGCCYLANEDLVGLKMALEKYCLEDPTFETQREKKFLNSMLAACENRDLEMFGKTVNDY